MAKPKKGVSGETLVNSVALPLKIGFGEGEVAVVAEKGELLKEVVVVMN